MGQRGFTLIEVLAAAGIAILVSLAVAAGVNHGAGEAGLAGRQFDASLAYARTLAARSGGGATVLLDASGVRVYSGRPTAPGMLAAAPEPAIPLNVAISEASLGAAPLALFVDASGAVTMERYAGATPPPLATQPACPSAGAWLLRLAGPRSTQTRSLPCSSWSSGL